MLFSIPMQFHILIFSIIAGVITGILFDLYRVFRGLENPNKIITFIEDTMFWILTGIIVFIFLFSTNNAYMSAYVYCFLSLGIVLYILLLSRTFIKIQYKITKNIIRVIRIVFNFLTYPLHLVFYKIKRKNKQKILKKKLEENQNTL